MTDTLTTIGTLEARITLKDRSDDRIRMRRYEVYDGDKHLGWVTRYRDEREWVGYVSAHVNTYTEGVASQIAQHYARQIITETRHEFVRELAAYLTIYAFYPERDK